MIERHIPEKLFAIQLINPDQPPPHEDAFGACPGSSGASCPCPPHDIGYIVKNIE